MLKRVIYYSFVSLHSILAKRIISEISKEEMKPGHQPERFKDINFLPSQRAFTIKDSNYVFHLDRYGGWYDEHGNYYSQNCEPDQPPSSGQSYSHGSDCHSEGSSGSDQFQKQFGVPKNESEDEVSHEQEQLHAIASNLVLLEAYPQKSQVRVYFQNLGHHSTREEIIAAYSKKVSKIANVVIDKSGNRNMGTGHFIVGSTSGAVQLVHCQGAKLIERPLFFTVQKYQSFLLSPITAEQRQWRERCRYVPKHKQKRSQKQLSKEGVVIPWRWYKFQRELFPKKSSFKQWMHEHGFIYQQDFRIVQRLDNDPEMKYAKIQLKESTYKSANLLQFQGKKIEFIPLL